MKGIPMAQDSAVAMRLVRNPEGVYQLELHLEDDRLAYINLNEDYRLSNLELFRRLTSVFKFENQQAVDSILHELERQEFTRRTQPLNTSDMVPRDIYPKSDGPDAHTQYGDLND